MGLQGFFKFLQSKYPACLIPTTLESMRGTRVAVDAEMWLYAALYKTPTDEFLLYFANRSHELLMNGIYPLFVFDGKPPEEKYVVEERKKRRKVVESRVAEMEQKAIEVPETAPSMEAAAAKLRTQIICVTPEHKRKCIHFLEAFGFITVTAEYEADQVCATLCSAGVVDAVMTDDLDCMAFGAPRVLRKNRCQNGITPYHIIELRPVLDSLHLTVDRFLLYCVLAGCDYVPSPLGVGPVKALRMAQLYENVEKCVERCKFNVKFRPDFVEKANAAIRIFKSPETCTELHPSALSEDALQLPSAQLLERISVSGVDIERRANTTLALLSEILYV